MSGDRSQCIGRKAGDLRVHLRRKAQQEGLRQQDRIARALGQSRDFDHDFRQAIEADGDNWSVTVNLRDYVTWSDGEPMDANDVVGGIASPFSILYFIVIIVASALFALVLAVYAIIIFAWVASPMGGDIFCCSSMLAPMTMVRTGIP